MPLRRVLLVTCAVALLPTACGSSAATELTQPSASGASGCGSAASSGSTTAGISAGGVQRTVIVHVPQGYTGNTELALVLNLHGSGATAADQEAFSGMDSYADSQQFLVAYPQGAITDGSGYDWNVPGQPLVGGRSVPAGAADDVTFLTLVVTALEARYCVNPTRVYATGFSGGARMASQLACDASTVFAAVAPVSGLRHPTPCAATRAVPVIAFHGTADPVDPYDGDGQAYWTYSVPTAASDWAAQDGCSPTPQTQNGSGYTMTTYSSCAGGAGVTLYTITGEGHEWPNGPSVPIALGSELGPQSTAVDANSAMWMFFGMHTLTAS